MSRRARERGAALLIAALLVLTVAIFAAVVGASLSTSDVADSSAQGSSVEALYAAESGLERAIKQFTTGSLCGAAAISGAS